MQGENRFFDDMARVAGGALNALSGLKSDFESLVRQQMEAFITSMKLVTRDELDIVQAMAAKARDEQETLGPRIERLEAELAELRAEITVLKAAKPSRKAAKSGDDGGAPTD